MRAYETVTFIVAPTDRHLRWIVNHCIEVVVTEREAREAERHALQDMIQPRAA